MCPPPPSFCPVLLRGTKRQFTIALLALMFCSLLLRKESGTSNAESDPWSSGGDGRVTGVSASSPLNLRCLPPFDWRVCWTSSFTLLFFLSFTSSSSSSSVGCWAEDVERRATLNLKVKAPDVGLGCLGDRSGSASSSSSSAEFWREIKRLLFFTKKKGLKSNTQLQVFNISCSKMLRQLIVSVL